MNSRAESQNQNKATVLDAILNQEQTVPSVTTRAHRSGAVTLNADRSEIGFRVAVSDIVDITKSHIHVGAAGEKGPHIFVLSTTSFKNFLTGTLKEIDLVPQPKQGISTFQDALDAILNGRTYINVHTLAHPGEEIRGQITRK